MEFKKKNIIIKKIYNFLSFFSSFFKQSVYDPILLFDRVDFGYMYNHTTTYVILFSKLSFCRFVRCWLVITTGIMEFTTLRGYEWNWFIVYELYLHSLHINFPFCLHWWLICVLMRTNINVLTCFDYIFYWKIVNETFKLTWTNLIYTYEKWYLFVNKKYISLQSFWRKRTK